MQCWVIVRACSAVLILLSCPPSSSCCMGLRASALNRRVSGKGVMGLQLFTHVGVPTM